MTGYAEWPKGTPNYWALPAILSSAQLFYFGTYLPHRHEEVREPLVLRRSVVGARELAVLVGPFDPGDAEAVRRGADDGRDLDGALLHSLRVPFGYWEAKDDDLDQEIARKFKRGYPRDNIVFSDDATAAPT